MTALAFDAENHAYRLDGRDLPSVTQVLNPYTGLEFVSQGTLEAARELGTHVHEAVHLFNVGRLEHCPDRVRPYLSAWKSFLEESGAVVITSEARVYSDKHRYAGALDTIVDWKDRECLIDCKSGVVPKTVGPQTSAYLAAYNEMFSTRIRTRYCVQLKPDGTYRVHKLTDSRDWNVFLAALTVWKWHKGKL